MIKTVHIEGRWIIKAPVEKVYEMATNYKKWPEYFIGIESPIKVIKKEKNLLVVSVTLYHWLVGRHVATLKMTLNPPHDIFAENESKTLGKERERMIFNKVPEGTEYVWINDMQPRFLILTLGAFLLRPWIRKVYERNMISRYRAVLEK